MIEIWYAILSFMLLMFVVLEGFDIGAGMLQYVVGKDDAQRRMVIAAIGPLWTWNEVWLVAFGGTLLLAFPVIMAATFSGFYMAIFLLLWALVLRGVSIEMSGQINESLWRTAWHFCFVASNVLLAILIGAALGNVLRGVPVGADGKFGLALFTNFAPSGNVGILDWYTVSVAVFILVAFAAHGATGLAHRTTGIIRGRSFVMARFLWKLIVVLLAIITIETWFVRPEFFPAMLHRPFGWLGVLGVVAGIASVFISLGAQKESHAFMGSCVFIAGLMVAGAAGVFPFMLRSTVAPEYSVSAYHTAADGQGLVIALIWWPIALCLALIYASFVYKHYRGRVQLAEDGLTPY